MSQSSPPRGMPVNPGWYAVAVQALVVLCRAGEVCPSGMLAEQVGTHAVFIRRILAQLVRAGLVEAREGRIGGYHVMRPPNEILLGDIYRALQVSLPDVIATAERGPTLEPRVQAALSTIYQEVEQFFIKTLDMHTLADITNAAEPEQGNHCPPFQSALDNATD